MKNLEETTTSNDNQNFERERQIRHLESIVQDIAIGLLTTVGKQGKLSSRPMKLIKFDRELLELSFFSDLVTQHTLDILENPQVNVSFASNVSNSFASISGRAVIIQDIESKEELWSPVASLWFQKSAAHMDIALIKVKMDQGEYWDSSSIKFINFLSMAKAFITGERPDKGLHQVINL